MDHRSNSNIVSWDNGVLDAYVDGELSEDERAAIELRLSADPGAADYVRQGRVVRNNLHRLFDTRRQSPIPAAHVELGLKIERELDRHRRPQWIAWLVLPVQLALAAVLAVVTLGAIALVLSATFGGPSNKDLFALFSPETIRSDGTDAVPASASQQNSVEAMTAAESDVTLTVDETTQPTQEAEPGAPDFGRFGFDLASARLLANHDDNSMQLVYESDDGRRIELFYSPDPGSEETSLTVMEDGPISALFWRNGGRSYSLIGDVDRDTILSLGRVVDGEWTATLPERTGETPGNSNDTGSADSDQGVDGSAEGENL